MEFRVSLYQSVNNNLNTAPSLSRTYQRPQASFNEVPHLTDRLFFAVVPSTEISVTLLLNAVYVLSRDGRKVITL